MANTVGRARTRSSGGHSGCLWGILRSCLSRSSSPMCLSMVNHGQNLAPGNSHGHGRYIRSLRRGCCCCRFPVIARSSIENFFFASRTTNSWQDSGLNSCVAFTHQWTGDIVNTTSSYSGPGLQASHQLTKAGIHLAFHNVAYSAVMIISAVKYSLLYTNSLSSFTQKSSHVGFSPFFAIPWGNYTHGIP